MWTNVILESVAKTEKDRKAREILEDTAKEVEETKKMVSALMNIMRDDEEETTSLDRNKMLKKKLEVIADYLEDKYGGLSFVAPLKVEMNMNLIKLDRTSEGSENEEENKYTFMRFCFSKTAENIRYTMMKNFSNPHLKNAKKLMECVVSQKPLLIRDSNSLNLPNGHFPIVNVLLGILYFF
jgi:hypothetical protein